jgi:hypothetical protein
MFHLRPPVWKYLPSLEQQRGHRFAPELELKLESEPEPDLQLELELAPLAASPRKLAVRVED